MKYLLQLEGTDEDLMLSIKDKLPFEASYARILRLGLRSFAVRFKEEFGMVAEDIADIEGTIGLIEEVFKRERGTRRENDVPSVSNNFDGNSPDPEESLQHEWPLDSFQSRDGVAP